MECGDDNEQHTESCELTTTTTNTSTDQPLVTEEGTADDDLEEGECSSEEEAPAPVEEKKDERKKVDNLKTKNSPVQTATKTNQNQMKMKVFSLMILTGSTQSPSFFSTVPEGPYLWKVHLVTLGKTLAIGSGRSSCSNPV